MKQLKLYLFIFSSFFLFISYVSADPVYRYSSDDKAQRPSFSVRNNGKSSGEKIPIMGTDVTIDISHYITEETGTDAFCLDPNLSSGTSYGLPFFPGLENSHTQNLYNFHLNTSDKDFTSAMIRMGQNYMDTEGYRYADMSTALRMHWFKHAWNVDKSTHYPGYTEELYNAFVDYNPYDLEGGSGKIYNDNPYGNGEEKADGFKYTEGFWEAKAKKANGSKDFYKTEDGKMAFYSLYTTNIRSKDFDVNKVEIEYANRDDFEITYGEGDDPLFPNSGKKVVDLYVRSKDGVDLKNVTGFEIVINYRDAREANNFWVTYFDNTSGTYNGIDSDAKQRMYVIDKVNGSLSITVGDPEKTVETPSNSKPCNPSSTLNYCTKNAGSSFTISDNFDCIFNENNINTDVYNSNKRHSHTTKYNKYCNISCAEKIDFTFPTKFDNVVAGTYFEMKNTDITATGTRTCKAYLDMGKFDQIVKKYNSSLNDATAKAVLKYSPSKGRAKYYDNSDYSYAQQNIALARLSKNISSSYTGTVGSCCDWNSLGNCTKNYYSVEENINGLKFSGTSCGSSTISSSDMKYENNSNYSLSDFKDDVESAVGDTVSKISSELKLLDECTSNFNQNKDSIEKNYDFNPDITFEYKEKYTNLFKDKLYSKSDVKTIKLDTNRSFSKLNDLQYYDTASSDISNHQYDALSGNGVQVLNASVTKQYSSFTSPLNKNLYSAAPTGEIVTKDAGKYINYTKRPISVTTVNELYIPGYDIYPVALNSNKSAYSTDTYTFYIKNLGDFDITASTQDSTGRFDKIINQDKRLYSCEYSIVKDITGCDSDEKPCYFYRNISLNNFDPNDRVLGKNWNVDDTVFGQKALATLDNLDKGDGETYDEEPEYHFVLTPENMQNIRRYNSAQETGNDHYLSGTGISSSKLGYANFEMKKVNETGAEASSDSVWYKSIFLEKAKAQNWVKESKYKTEFVKWDDAKRLTGPGPAWK